MLSALPDDINRYEILPRLDDPSLMVLRHVLFGSPYKSLTIGQQKIVVSHGMKFTQHFFDLGLLDKYILCKLIIECDNLELLQWARANNCPWDNGSAAKIYLYGNMDMYEWSVKNGCTFNYTNSLIWLGWMYRGDSDKVKAKYFSETHLATLTARLANDADYQKYYIENAKTNKAKDVLRYKKAATEFMKLWIIVKEDVDLSKKIIHDWLDARSIYRKFL